MEQPTLFDLKPGSDAHHLDAGAFWLAVNGPARGGDLAAHLGQAAALFRTKERWRGRPPNTVKAHPTDAGNGLAPVAGSLGLAVIDDARVLAGTFWLGLATEEGQP